jgi:tetratricopeptide (TPR) repeat protein
MYYLTQAHGRLAKQLFEKLRAELPDSARTHQLLGDARAAENRAEAVRHFQAALAARPDLRSVHYALGELFLAAGDYQNAETEFRSETRLAPGSAAAAYQLGVALAHLGRSAEALEELKRASSLEPGMPEPLLELGKLLNATGDAKSAEGHLRRALEIESGGALAEAAHFQLAQAYRKLGRVPEAEREMRTFQEMRAGRRRGSAKSGDRPAR